MLLTGHAKLKFIGQKLATGADFLNERYPVDLVQRRDAREHFPER